MNQIVKDKMQRQIMVIKNEILFCKNSRREWLLPSDENFEELILENFEYMVRWEAEVNFEYKQPIPYGVLVSNDKKVFVYKRWWSTSNAWDSRLHSKISLWVWGHIEVEDKVWENLLKETLIREVEEEVGIKDEDIKDLKVLGYINYDSDEVSKVHFWVCYAILTNKSETALTDGELESWEFLNIEEIWNMIESGEYDVEAWSKIIFEDIKKFVESL